MPITFVNHIHTSPLGQRMSRKRQRLVLTNCFVRNCRLQKTMFQPYIIYNLIFLSQSRQSSQDSTYSALSRGYVCFNDVGLMIRKALTWLSQYCAWRVPCSQQELSLQVYRHQKQTSINAGCFDDIYSICMQMLLKCCYILRNSNYRKIDIISFCVQLCSYTVLTVNLQMQVNVCSRPSCICSILYFRIDGIRK